MKLIFQHKINNRVYKVYKTSAGMIRLYVATNKHKAQFISIH